MKRRLLLVLFFLYTIFGALTLEVTEGRIKLVVHEASGRFSLYYLSNLTNNTYQALFVNQDPRTSFFSVLIDDRAHKMGESTSFRSRVERDGSAVVLVFESPNIQVRQSFSFIKTKGVSLADGVLISFQIINRGDKDTSIAARFLLDTNLGERNSSPFGTNLQSIGEETLITPKNSSGDLWWFSGDEKLGLMGSIVGPELTTPASVHFANWKRLNDATWSVNYSANRNFNMLPYSIGDSAVCYYYDTEVLARGAERSISLALSYYNPLGFDTAKTDTNDLSILLRTSSEAADDPELALRTDLITIRDYLLRIDDAIKSGGDISDEELKTFEAIIDRLKQRNEP